MLYSYHKRGIRNHPDTAMHLEPEETGNSEKRVSEGHCVPATSLAVITQGQDKFERVAIGGG